MPSLRSQIFDTLEAAGRTVTAGRAPTLREVYEQLGGRGSAATRIIAQELGVSQRQAQRYVTTAGQRRAPGRLRELGVQRLSARELRRAGVRALRDRTLRLTDDSTVQLCYGGEPQGQPRDVGGIELGPDVTTDWLDAVERGLDAQARGDRAGAERGFADAEEEFSVALLNEYGGFGGGDVDICPDGADVEFEVA